MDILDSIQWCVSSFLRWDDLLRHVWGDPTEYYQAQSHVSKLKLMKELGRQRWRQKYELKKV